MAMPALQAWRRTHPGARLVLLVKPKLQALWSLHPAPDEVWALPPGLPALLAMARAVRRARFRTAYVLPHSFRSALPPFLARVPERVGLPGHGRDWMLTRVAGPAAGAAGRHQALEYTALFGVPGAPEPPRLRLPPGLLAQADARLGSAPAGGWIALLPGAAYGPAKRWPADRFGAAGRLLIERLGCRIVVLGAGEERALCETAARGAGPGAVNLAGQTSLAELSAVLARCRAALTNDSGGMHVATAVGTPVAAVFGITDPVRTGPLGPAAVLQASARRSRDLPRDSREARESLARIAPGQAAEAVLSLLALPPGGRGA